MTAPGNRASLALSRELLGRIARHAEETYPDECCGILIGRDGGAGRVVERVRPIDNRWEAGERGHRFLIAPDDLLRAEREARRAGLDVLGFYHSHPDGPPAPSLFDRDQAWPWYTYLIMSIEQGRYRAVAGWQLRDDREAFEEVTLTTLDREPGVRA